MQMNKSELRNVVRSAVKDFIHAHPDALEPKWIESVTKRVTGQLYCHYVHNKIKNGKVEKVPCPYCYKARRIMGKEYNEYCEFCDNTLEVTEEVAKGYIPHSGNSI